jgi:hypothetical protein
MRKFLIIDTEDAREKVETTSTKINTIVPLIKKINKNENINESMDGYEILISLSPFDIEEITSINIVYHS